MRVCHLGKYYPPARGGIETHVHALAHAQAALGADVEVLCVNHRNPAGEDVRSQPWATTRTVREEDGPVRVTRVGRRMNVRGFDVCPRLPFLLRELDRRGVDVVHVHLPNPTMLLALATCPVKARFVAAHHSDIVRQQVLRHAVLPLKRRLLRRADRIIAMCEAYAQSSSLLSEFASKVEVIPLGLDLEPLADPSPTALRHRDGLRARYEGPRWLSVGRIVYYKGLQHALRALQEVQGTYIIIGRGPEEFRLRELSRELGVADRVAWLGDQTPDQVAGAYHAATALMFPSDTRSEAFGLAQVEAMASSCPVINCSIPGSGVPWVAPHNEAGLTVPPADPRAFARAAERLQRDDELRKRLGVKGRSRALREFASDVMARRTLDLYAKMGVG